MHDVVTESQDTTELCDVYLVGSELCGVCCVLWCVGSGFQVQGLGSGNLDPMRATPVSNLKCLQLTIMQTSEGVPQSFFNALTYGLFDRKKRDNL
jgi:hypothetical protein